MASSSFKHKTSIRLFAGTASQALGHQVAACCGQSLGRLQVHRFRDGEMMPIFRENVQGAHVCLIQATYPPADHIMELLLAIDAARGAGAASVTAVVPYWGYARQDSARCVGSAVGARLQAKLMASAGAHRLVTCELHSQQAANGPGILVKDLSSMAVFAPYIRRLQLPHFMFVSPDAGGLGRAQQYARHFQVPWVGCSKHRAAANEVVAVQVLGHVRGAHVVLVDDLVDTGDTLCKAAAALKAQGARTVRACCTHPVLSGGAYRRLEESVLEELVVTDTIPIRHPGRKLKVISVAPLLAQALQRLP